jgi:myo-inositol-1(or 4)-monophosphatase
MRRPTTTPPAAALRTGKALAAPLARLVTATGIAAARAQARLRPGQMIRKGEGDFVTVVDVRLERRLRPQLRRLCPGAGILGEELPTLTGDGEWSWVVDPIDGTSNYGRGLPQFAVSVALLWRGWPVLAAIHCRPEAATYVALHGAGTRRNGRRLVAADRPLDDASIVGCQWLRGQQDLAFLARLQRAGNRIRTLGSTVTQLADVAAGRLDGNVQEQGRLWDIAAAGLVVREAGCRFTDWHGKDVFPFLDLEVEHTPSVAAPPTVHRALLRCLDR